MLEENKCADSFIGTLAYMSPDRVRGLPYSYEADMWSLGVTMITIIRGKPPFPTKRGPWHLMNAIIQGPQPTLDPGTASLELRSFIHDCLNQPPEDSTCAKRLLDHAFLTNAKNRGVITTPAFLPRPAVQMQSVGTTLEVIDKIVAAAISWQLERYEIEQLSKFNINRQGVEDESKEPSSTIKLPQYSKQKIEGLASQMLVKSSILQERLVCSLLCSMS